MMGRRVGLAFLAFGMVVSGPGCDLMTKKQVRTKTSTDELAALDPPVVSKESEEAPAKSKLFKNNRLSGGLSDQAREIEQDFGIH
ncbi:hypothetical protein EP7_004579 [Isosphaeraceae bacterium EP7]